MRIWSCPEKVKISLDEDDKDLTGWKIMLLEWDNGWTWMKCHAFGTNAAKNAWEPNAVVNEEMFNWVMLKRDSNPNWTNFGLELPDLAW